MWESVSEKREKGKKKENSKLSCPPSGSPLAVARKHIHTSVLPCYHDTTTRQARTVFQEWKIPMEGYTTVGGPPITILWPESLMLFQITDTEQQGETARPLTSQEHETLSAAYRRIIYVWKNS